MKFLKISIFVLLVTLLHSCFEDKGSYDYQVIPTLKIENLKDFYPMIANVDKLTLEPKIISSTEGEISSDNPNYEYKYQISISRKEDDVTVYWTEIDNEGSNFDQIINAKAGEYKLWFTVTDKRTGIFADHLMSITLATPTTEGWMLLGTDGTDNRTRMDMISVISTTRSEVAVDILASRGLPVGTKGANCIGFYPNAGILTKDRIFAMTDNGAFTLNNETMETSEKSTINYTDFANVNELQSPVKVWAFTGANGGNLIVTANGDAYAMAAKTSGGPRFLDKINTSMTSTPSEYKLAPFVGYDSSRPDGYTNVAVLYDVTNMRFMGWYTGTKSGTITFPLTNPTNGRLFDYTNADKTVSRLIYLGPSSFMRRAYSVLENKDGSVDIAGITMLSSNFQQSVFYSDVTATDISKASQFAFSCEYPVVYYAVGDKLYTYNMESKICTSKSFSGESITKLKFNRWQNTMSGSGVLNKSDDPEFMDQQNQLIVCSYNESKPSGGGTFRMYRVDGQGEVIDQPVREYFNLCRVADVVYRERRK